MRKSNFKKIALSVVASTVLASSVYGANLTADANTTSAQADLITADLNLTSQASMTLGAITTSANSQGNLYLGHTITTAAIPLICFLNRQFEHSPPLEL